MKLLDQVRQALRVKRFALRTEQCYVRWTVGVHPLPQHGRRLPRLRVRVASPVDWLKEVGNAPNP